MHVPGTGAGSLATECCMPGVGGCCAAADSGTSSWVCRVLFTLAPVAWQSLLPAVLLIQMAHTGD
jgi:hypothetical protein